MVKMVKLMDGYEYDEAILSKEQKERIAEINKACDASIEEADKNEAYLMDNYYNCVDEYSWGGPCSRANDLKRNNAEYERICLIKEVILGYIPLVKEINILKDLNGNVVARGVRSGKFGAYFKTFNDVYVSCRNRLSTYQKKGYIPYVVTTIEKATLHHDRYGHPYLEGYEMIEEKEEISTRIIY
jgi:hypothetical protein